MSTSEAAFEAEIEAHRARHAADPWSVPAQEELQKLHLARADALGATAASEAHLRVAEDCQWRIGTTSGSGDGLESMGKLYEIRARRAKLWEALGDKAQALDLWESIAADPNGLGRFAEPEIARLQG